MVQSTKDGSVRPGSTRLWLLVPLLLVLTACGEDILYSDLSEREANEMVALLYAADLSASKHRENDARYSIQIGKDSFSRAVALLQANGLPRKSFDTLGSVFAKEGFVSSPLEERARLNHALSQEIAHTLSSIDGVVMARVHLAVPPDDALRDEPRPASASVFVKHRADRDLTGSLGQIKALLVNSVEGLPYGNVTVALFPADASFLDSNILSRLDVETETAPTLSVLRGIVPAIEWKWVSLMSVIALLLCGLAWFWKRERLNVRGHPVAAAAEQVARQQQ